METLFERTNDRITFWEIKNYVKDFSTTVLCTQCLSVFVERLNERLKILCNFGGNNVVEEAFLEGSLVVQTFSMELLIFRQINTFFYEIFQVFNQNVKVWLKIVSQKVQTRYVFKALLQLWIIGHCSVLLTPASYVLFHIFLKIDQFLLED